MGNTFSGCFGGNAFNPYPPQYATPGVQPGVQPGYGTVPQHHTPVPTLLAELHQSGLPITHIDNTQYAVLPEDAIHIQSLRDALVNGQPSSDVSSRLCALLNDGTNRSAFQGAIVLARSGLLRAVFQENAVGRSTWVHSLASGGREAQGQWQGSPMSLAERFEALTQVGLSLTELDPQGKSPCIHALEQGNETTFNALLDTNQVDAWQLRGTNALAVAAKSGRDNAVRRLLNQFNLDPNDTVDGATALHHGVRSGNAEVVQLLLAAGANPATNVQGWGTPLDVADAAQQTHIAQMLRNAAASTTSGSGANTSQPPGAFSYPGPFPTPGTTGGATTGGAMGGAPGVAGYPGGIPGGSWGGAGNSWGGGAGSSWGGAAAGAGIGATIGTLGAAALANSQLTQALIASNAIMGSNNIMTGAAAGATDSSLAWGSGGDGGWYDYGYKEGLYDGDYQGDIWYGD